MELFPAIDLRNGKCVRLHQGDYGQETIYGDDPVAQALAFADAGAIDTGRGLLNLSGAVAGGSRCGADCFRCGGLVRWLL